MIKHSLEKIEKLIREKEYQLPQIMLKLYCFLLHYAKKLEQKGSEYVALNLYSDALKLFRNHIVEEPFKLTKVTCQIISQGIESQSFQNLSQIFEIRDRYAKELSAFIPNDAFFKKVVAEMNELKWAKKIQINFAAAELLKKQLEQKKGQISYLSQLTILLWFGVFKGEGLVHVDTFIEKLVPFCHQYFQMLDFIDQNSFSCLRELIDPQRKYYLSVSGCEQFFIKIRQPDIIENLWLLTQQKTKPDPFMSESSMMIRLTVEDKTINEIYGITGQKIISPDGQQKDVKLPPTIMIGSSVDCDIIIKSKYVSRKQMIVVEDRKSDKIKESTDKKHNFSIVGLSQTNFTPISYPTRTKAGVGHIFYGGDVKYQLLVCQKREVDMQSIAIEDDRTLSIMPHEKGPKSFNVRIQKLTFLILSGTDKEKEISFLTKEMSMSQGGNHHLAVLRQVLQFDEEFYFKPGTKILIKTANEIVQGRPSRKIRLRKDMKIFLQEFTLNIE